MAEAVGLALGTVALASLFSTCLELFGRFELGRNYPGDYELTCTKLGLLRLRLVKWGEALNIDHPGQECELLRVRWPKEQMLVERSLTGISTIFKTTYKLVEKYKSTAARNSSIPKADSNLCNSRSHVSNVLKNVRPDLSFRLVRRRTIWAVHDKEQLDASIAELEFFIRNLEKLRLRLSKVDTAEGAKGSTAHGDKSSGDNTEDTYKILRPAANSSAPIKSPLPVENHTRPVSISHSMPDNKPQQSHIAEGNVQTGNRSAHVVGRDNEVEVEHKNLPKSEKETNTTAVPVLSAPTVPMPGTKQQEKPIVHGSNYSNNYQGGDESTHSIGQNNKVKLTFSSA